jgi:hypothetical protein
MRSQNRAAAAHTYFQPSENETSGVRPFLDTMARFDTSIIEAQQMRAEPHKEVGRSEMLRIYYGCVFQALSVILAFLVIAVSFGAFGLGAPIQIDGVTVPGSAVAFGETVFALGAGYVSSRLIRNSSPETASLHRSEWAGIASMGLAYMVALAVIAANAAAFLSYPSEINIIWFAPHRPA